MKRGWMVRAERDGRLYDVFKERSVVAIGWHELGSLADLSSRETILKRVRQTWPDLKQQAAAMSAGQLHRFRNEMKPGDTVLTYDPRRRIYLTGEIVGNIAGIRALIHRTQMCALSVGAVRSPATCSQ